MDIIESEVLIIGGGIAGLMAAEYLSMQKNVIIITKSELNQSNSFMAQGGISAAIGKDDTWQQHFADTIEAGHLYNDRKMTERLVKEAPNVIRTLDEWGVPFDKEQTGILKLGKEGGHQQNRIVHAGGDRTGKRIMEVLSRRVGPKVKVVTGQYAVDLAVWDNRCFGVFCKDEAGNHIFYSACNIILAGGGYAGIYSISSNGYGSDGSAVCMAYRAGALLADLEFVQFHPTLLTEGNQALGLITEAVRGQGAVLRNTKGNPIMKGYHPMGDLAPRDIVSRKMFEEIHDNREQVFLDIRKVERFAEKFPGVTAICKKGGIPIEDGFIPVAPGAHFTMGGIITDENGATTIEGLYAIGECANTGVHGANRLASNSLLEGAVFAKRSADHILKKGPLIEKTLISPALWLYEDENRTENDILDEGSIKSAMDECAGICRSHERLKKGKHLLHMQNLKPFLLNKPISYIRRTNMQMMAWLTVTSSLQRTESRGSHFRIDFKEPCRSWDQKKIIRSLIDDESSIVKKTAAGIFN